METNPDNLPQLHRPAVETYDLSKAVSAAPESNSGQSSRNQPEPIEINCDRGGDHADATGRDDRFWDDSTTRTSTPFCDRPTELGNADYFNQQYGQEFLWNVTRRQWMTWQGTHWAEDCESDAARRAKEVVRDAFRRMKDSGLDDEEAARFAKQSETARGVKAILELAKSEPGRSVTEPELDADPLLVNFANGTLDLRPAGPYAHLGQHDRRQYLKTCISTPFDSTATAPRWSAFLNQIMAGDTDMIEYLQRLAGSCLSGESNLQELYIAYGPGANGKSVFFDTLLSVLEGYGCTAPESLLTSRGGSDHPTTVARLVGKRMVVASETEAGARLRVQQMKRLTGDRVITARFMRRDYFEFRRTFKLIMITNNRPKITENTDAVWRRLRLIPFDVVIPEANRDPDLLDTLKAERPGILAWMVAGWEKFKRNGLPPPAKVQTATESYRDEVDEVPEFVRDYCRTGDPDTHWCSRAELYSAYLTFAESDKEPDTLSRANLYSRLEQIPGILRRNPKIAGRKVRGFAGISL